MRLRGPSLGRTERSELVSDAVAPGSVQVPGDGQPIVLLADRQTTGGYPKIATVISADLPALGRLAAGTRIAFEPVSLEAAESARRKLLADIASLGQRIVPLRPTDAHCLRAPSPAAPAAA
jgi:allophanate hydrolase subunit 2